MKIKTTGAEFKRFYNDPKAWPGSAGQTYVDDLVLTVDGQSGEDTNLEEVEDTAEIVVISGDITSTDLKIDGRDITAHFSAWRMSQKTVSALIEFPIEKADAVRAAVEASGGVWCL